MWKIKNPMEGGLALGLWARVRANSCWDVPNSFKSVCACLAKRRATRLNKGIESLDKEPNLAFLTFPNTSAQAPLLQLDLLSSSSILGFLYHWSMQASLPAVYFLEHKSCFFLCLLVSSSRETCAYSDRDFFFSLPSQLSKFQWKLSDFRKMNRCHSQWYLGS